MNIEQIINSLNFTTIFWQAGATLIFMVADIITGLIQAVINKNLDSQKMREGILRKALLILIVILSFVAQYAFNIPAISKVVCIYIIVMEVISIFENLKKAGVDLGKLGEILKIKSDNEEIDINIKESEDKKIMEDKEIVLTEEQKKEFNNGKGE